MNVIDLDERAVNGTEQLIAKTPSERWAAPTPCSEWDVHDLIRHLVAGNVKYTGIANGDNWQPGAPEMDIGEQPAEAYRRTAQELIEAWRQPGVTDREIDLPRGRRGAAEKALWIHLVESLVHGWDLARATGQEPAFDEDVVAAALADVQGRTPAQRGPESPFTDAKTAPEGAPLIDQLAAYLGRDVTAWSG